jgi:hypothetical protein
MSMIRLGKAAFFAMILLFYAAAANAGPVSVQCPDKVDVAENAAAVGNWQVYVASATHSFSRLRIYNGQPQSKVVLDPDDADEQAENYRWTLGEAGDNLWVECSFHASAIRLIQQLPKGLHSCEAEKAGSSLSITCE